jgi:hypothetical protein
VRSTVCAPVQSDGQRDHAELRIQRALKILCSPGRLVAADVLLPWRVSEEEEEKEGPEEHLAVEVGGLDGVRIGHDDLASSV